MSKLARAPALTIQSRRVVDRRRFLAAAGLAAPAALLPACRRSPSSRKIVLRLSHSQAPGATALDVLARAFQQQVAARTDGRVEVRIFPNGTLGQEREVVQQLQQGLVDVMSSGTAIWGSVAPRLQIADLPFLWRDYAHIERMMDGEVGRSLAAYLEETTGIHVLGWGHSFGFRNVVTRRKEVRTPDDLAGLKIRTIQSSVYVKTVELMGASPTPMAFGEIYTSLQTGVIDGFEHDASTTLASRFYEVTRYTARTAHIAGVLILSMTARTLATLPPDLRAALEEAGREAGMQQRVLAPVEDERSLAALLAKQMTFHDIDRRPLIERARALWTSLAREVGAEALVQQMVS